MFAAIVFVLTSGCSWREIPKVLGVSWQTAHRRFTQWDNAGIWEEVGRIGAQSAVDDHIRLWASRVSVAAAERAGRRTQPTPQGEAAVASRRRPTIRRRITGSFFERLFGPRKVFNSPLVGSGNPGSPETVLPDRPRESEITRPT